MAVDPRGVDLKRFSQEDPGGPVFMLNLLRFAPNGRESYARYARGIDEHLRAVGGEVVYSGAGDTALVGDDTQAWDAVMIVRYPSRQAFLDMVANREYQEFTHYRTAALSEAVLQPTVPWNAGRAD